MSEKGCQVLGDGGKLTLLKSFVEGITGVFLSFSSTEKLPMLCWTIKNIVIVQKLSWQMYGALEVFNIL